MKKSKTSIKQSVKKKNDHRMLFLKNIDELENVRISDREIEVITDGYTVGNFDFGPYLFCIWEFSHDKKKGEERKLCLRIKERIYTLDDRYWEKADEKGFYHGGDIVDEILALSSLFLQRRFKRGPTVRWEDKPHLIPKYKEWIDEFLIVGKRNLTELSSWFELIKGLDDNLHQKFILAARLYHQAILIIEEQPDLAYLNLVSAIEALCREQKIKKVKLHELDSGLAELVDSIEDLELKAKIERGILNRERFIRRKFTEFIVKHTEMNFWEYEGRPKLGQINPEDLPKLLKRIYDQRSNTLHEGKPFPSYLSASPLQDGEIVFAKAITIGGKRWEEQEYIPYPHFFERLVNHVLKTYLKRNQKN